MGESFNIQHMVMYFQNCSNSAYPMHSGERYRTDHMVIWFCIITVNTDLKLTLDHMGENVYYLIYRDKNQIWRVTYLKVFTTKKLWDELPTFWK